MKQTAVKGFVESIRDLNKVQFIIVRQDSVLTFHRLVQCVIQKNEANANINAVISALTRESVVEVEGTRQENPSVKLNGYEILITNIVVHSVSAEQLPVDDLSNEDTRANWRFLELRKKENKDIFYKQTQILQAMRTFLTEKGFIEIHTPKLIGTASESGAEVFKVDYFGKEAYLAQSPQFYKQMAIAADFNKVFEIAPAFRADKSDTNRHSSEFISIDLEMAWVKSHHDIMDLQEQMINHCLKSIEISPSPTSPLIMPFARVTFEMAKSIVEVLGSKGNPNEDFTPAEEKMLGEYASAIKSTDFIFVTDYPSPLRPFYHERDEETGLTKSFDLLYKGVEITSGAKREHKPTILEAQIKWKGLAIEPLQDYINFFKYGCPPHGGLGMGLARFVMLALKLDNIKKVELLHRDKNRLRP